MNSRFLTVAAIAGMLLAAGCGGGGSKSSSALPATPTTGTTGTSAKSAPGTGSLTASFLVPASVFANTASSATSRSAQYISPGTTGISLLLGNGVTFFPANGAAGSAQTNTGIGAGTLPTAATISLVPGTATVTPIPGQTLTITNNGSTSTVFSITSVSANNTVLTGNFATGQGSGATPNTFSMCTANNVPAGIGCTGAGLETALPSGSQVNFIAGSGTACNAANVNVTVGTGFPAATTPQCGQQFILGTQAAGAAITGPSGTSLVCPTTVYGCAGGTTTVTYSYKASTTTGYYLLTIALSGITAANGAASSAYTLGVVLTDLSNNNFVLSEGQVGPVATVASQGPSTNPGTVTLLPVVNGVYMPQASQINAGAAATAAGLGALNPPNSFETALFATDEKGFVIPNQAVNSDNQASVTISSAATNGLLIGTFAAPGTAPLTNTSVATLPAATVPGIVAGTAVLNSPLAASTAYTSITLTSASATPAVGQTVVVGANNFPVASASTASGITTVVVNPAVTTTAVAVPAGTAVTWAAIGATNNTETAPAATAVFAGNALLGTFFTNLAQPTAPNSVVFNSATAAVAVTAGIPINLSCGTLASANTFVKAVITSTAPSPATAVGYTLTPGTNYPAGTITLTNVLAPTATGLNCTPGFGVNIN